MWILLILTLFSSIPQQIEEPDVLVGFFVRNDSVFVSVQENFYNIDTVGHTAYISHSQGYLTISIREYDSIKVVTKREYNTIIGVTE